MKLYRVTYERRYDVLVEAEDKEEAKTLAFDEEGDVNISFPLGVTCEEEPDHPEYEVG